MYINSYHSNSKCVVLDHGGERANALRKKMDDENYIVVDLFVFPGATNPNLQWKTLADILPCITSFMFETIPFRRHIYVVLILHFTQHDWSYGNDTVPPSSTSDTAKVHENASSTHEKSKRKQNRRHRVSRDGILHLLLLLIITLFFPPFRSLVKSPAVIFICHGSLI